MKWLVTACAVCLVAVLVTAWTQLDDADIAVPVRAGDRAAAGVDTGDDTGEGRSAVADGATDSAAGSDTSSAASTRATRLAKELLAARRSCQIEQLDQFIDRLQLDIARNPQDGTGRRLCAEAILERVLLRNQHRGMVVGEPLYAELPEETAVDIDAGLQLIADARARGDSSADGFRIEAALLSSRITGIASALQYNGQIQRALQAAADKDSENPALHVTLGLRKLLAPRLLGYDPEKALEHLKFAAEEMLDDERPGVFAAMACYLLRKRQQAIEWLTRAVERNPNNVFARVVLKRVQRGEEDPFGRDLTAEELR